MTFFVVGKKLSATRSLGLILSGSSVVGPRPPARRLGGPRTDCGPPKPFKIEYWFVDLKGKVPGNDSGAFLL